MKLNFPPSKPPSVSLSSKRECLTKICGCFRKKKKHNQGHRQAKLICELNRTSLKKPSVLKKLPAHVNVSILSGTVHLRLWRTFSQDGDSASHYETQTMYFGYFDHLPIHYQKLFSMIPQQYAVRLVVGKNFFNPHRRCFATRCVGFSLVLKFTSRSCFFTKFLSKHEI